MKNWLFLIIFLSSAIISIAQDTDRKIQFPNVEGFLTLKTDLHIHTVFSDGHVWPTIRIEEAVKDGLDAISLTEHLEYQPWKEDMKHPDRNRSYHLAVEAAKPHNLLVIHGAEITRSMPPGHANALFISDANALLKDDALEAYREAHNQGAFVFWNHPNWINQQKNAKPYLSEMHKMLIQGGLLHGIEVVNDVTYSQEGLQLALEQNLTIMGTSDIHGLIDYQFELENGGHRPVTLVLARQRSIESIKEALFAGRTITWFRNNLTGKEENLKLLVDASLSFDPKGYIGDSQVFELEVSNISDARFILQNTSTLTLYNGDDLIEIAPHSRKTLQIILPKGDGAGNIEFEFLNTLIGLKKHLIKSVQF